jgi:hypothetical protein
VIIVPAFLPHGSAWDPEFAMKPAMKPTLHYRDLLSLLCAIALALTGLTGIAATSELSFAGPAMHAQATGFDAFANRVFGGNSCTAAAIDAIEGKE